MLMSSDLIQAHQTLLRSIAFAVVIVCVTGPIQAQTLFSNVSESAGVNAAGLHHSVAIGDFDQDGREDIYVGNQIRTQQAIPE